MALRTPDVVTPIGTPLLPGTPIVVFGDDWGRNVSTIQHLFRWIIPDYPVVWVNGIGHRKPQLSGADLMRAARKFRAMLGARRATGALVGGAGYPDPAAILQPKVLPWHDQSLIYASNVRAMRREIGRALGALGTTPAPVIVTGSPPSAGVVGTLGEAAAVYLCMDDFLHIPSATPSMIGPLEQSLLARVDAVVCTAESLTRAKVPRSGVAHYLPQGVNYEHLAAPRPLPEELAHLPRPLIGFVGALYERCDVPLLRQLAEAFPNGSVVLIGPIQMDTAPLTAPNMHVLGPRPYAALPAYVQGFDVGIIPYVLSEETLAVDPLKLLEYCAAGVPCVTTALPEARKYAQVVRVTESRDAFIAGVRAALAEDRGLARARGQALAREHTWRKRAEVLLRILGAAVEHHASRAREAP